MSKKDDKVNDTGQLEEKIAELENQVKRTLADYQNLEKRMAEQRLEWIRGANKDLILRILPVLDTLIMASKHSQGQGLQVSVQQFLDVLKSEGVERIKTIGEKFDPIKMECIQTVGSSDEQDEIVVEEVRPGFVLYDKVLRPAQVIVGQRKFKVSAQPLEEVS